MKRLRTRNRPRKGGQSPVFPVPLALLLAVVTILSLVYLWLNNRCVTLGQQIKEKERAVDELKRTLVNEEYHWSNMKSPQNIRRLLEVHHLPMSYPAEKDIVRLYPSGQAEIRGTRQLALGGSRGRHD